MQLETRHFACSAGNQSAVELGGEEENFFRPHNCPVRLLRSTAPRKSGGRGANRRKVCPQFLNRPFRGLSKNYCATTAYRSYTVAACLTARDFRAQRFLHQGARAKVFVPRCLEAERASCDPFINRTHVYHHARPGKDEPHLPKSKVSKLSAERCNKHEQRPAPGLTIASVP